MATLPYQSIQMHRGFLQPSEDFSKNLDAIDVEFEEAPEDQPAKMITSDENILDNGCNASAEEKTVCETGEC